jgi:glycogen debranching enzyme GlgX
VNEFKGMVKAMHRAGIEVILDVVYNHTAEGNHLGPMLAFKGIDNASYYRTLPADPRYYLDFTGTGNSLNPVHPSVLRLIMDSLRYFVIECHVDGFRFDLASALARELYEVDRLSAFFDIVHQDPVLSQVKLIAEPWDVGEGGYQVGNFPVLWTEWNGMYRDTMRERRRGLRVALHGVERPLPARRAEAVRVDQLRDRPRRLHAPRPRLLQREAQRGEPRGQRRRRQPQPELEPRGRGRDRRRRDQRAA